MPEILNNLVCTGCSLLCDDIAIEIENGKILKTHHVCARGFGRYYQRDFKYRLLKPILDENGQKREISYQDALKTVISLLKVAKNPVFYGWTSASSETQERGIQLAQKYRAIIDSSSTFSMGPAVQQYLQTNWDVPKLPAIKDNADVLLFWGCNPTASHIRLLSKYAIMARGENTSRGIEDRQVFTIDIRSTDMSKFSQLFLKIAPGKDKLLFDSILQILQGKSFTEDEIANLSRTEIYDLVNSLKDGRFGVLFFGNGYLKTPENLKVLFQFLDSMNQKGVKFGAIPLDGGYNAVGFHKSLKKAVNLELNADFRHNPVAQDQNLFIKSLKKGEIDLLFVLGADPLSNFPFSLSKVLAKIPIITIDYQQTPTTKMSKLVIPTTIPGVESAGTAYRLDFELISLKKSVDPPLGVHSDVEILTDLLKMS